MTESENSSSFSLTVDIKIRVATQQDLPNLEWYGLFKHFRNLFMRSYNEQLIGNRMMLVADFNAFPIGRLFIQFKSANPRIADGHGCGYIYSFQVMEMFRGMGIGTAMMDHAENILIQRRFTTAIIAVAKDNYRAQQLYAKRGYRIYDQSAGRWRYHDHNNRIKEINEPSWLMKKALPQIKV